MAPKVSIMSIRWPKSSTVAGLHRPRWSGNWGVARASVRPRTRSAPAFFRAAAQAESVAPVVITSSMSTTTRPRMRSGVVTSKTPRTFSLRCVKAQAGLRHRGTGAMKAMRLHSRSACRPFGFATFRA